MEHYRKRAKELLAALRGGDPEVARRFAQHARPRPESTAGARGAGDAGDAVATTPRARPTLTDAQRVVAREHGFTSWSRFKRALEARAAAARNQGGWQIVRTATADTRAGRESMQPRLDCALRELVEVVAVGESIRVDETTVTLLSLERYDDGFVVQFRLMHEYDRGDDVAVLSAAMPELRVSATDEQGHRYDVWPNGGSGGGARGLLSWRYAFRFAPAVDPSARALTVAIEAIEWRRMDPETRRLVPVREVAGPWTFTLGLGRAG